MRLLLMLGLGGLISALSMRATDPMLPILAEDLRVSIGQAALLASAYATPYSLMQLVLGPVGDSLGKTWMIRVALSILTTGLALSALAPGFSSLMAARMLSGAFAGGIIPVSMALIGDRVPLAERQPALSRFLLATILGQIAGGAATGVFVEAVGWRWTLGFYAVLAAAATATALLRLRERPDAPPPRRPSLLGGLRQYGTILRTSRARRVYLAVACEGALVFGLFPYLAPFLLSEGASTGQAGLAIGAFGLGGLAYAVFLRPILRFIGAAHMMPAGGCIAGGTLALVPLIQIWWVTAALFLLVGFGFYMLHNMLQLQATELSTTARASALALFSSSFFFGQGLGPPAVGASAAAIGLTPSFPLLGALIATLGIVAGRMIRPAGAS